MAASLKQHFRSWRGPISRRVQTLVRGESSAFSSLPISPVQRHGVHEFSPVPEAHEKTRERNEEEGALYMYQRMHEVMTSATEGFAWRGEAVKDRAFAVLSIAEALTLVDLYHVEDEQDQDPLYQSCLQMRALLEGTGFWTYHDIHVAWVLDFAVILLFLHSSCSQGQEDECISPLYQYRRCGLETLKAVGDALYTELREHEFTPFDFPLEPPVGDTWVSHVVKHLIHHGEEEVVGDLPVVREGDCYSLNLSKL